MDEINNNGFNPQADTPVNAATENVNSAPVYTQPPVYAQPPIAQAPARQLKTNRGCLKLILLSLITFGIYYLVVFTQFSEEINITASKYDGKKTMNYCLLVFVVSPITLCIGAIVWIHKFSARVGAEVARRNLGYSFGAGSFWGWCVLGSLIIVGPFIYLHKLCKSMNLINADYNIKG